MVEVFAHPEHVPVWHAAARGEMPDWKTLMHDYVAAVDWPASAFWPELTRAFPDAVILLSLRDPQSWWESASSTIFTETRKGFQAGALDAWHAMVKAVHDARFTANIHDRESSIAALSATTPRCSPPRRASAWFSGGRPKVGSRCAPRSESPSPTNRSRASTRASGGP
jgi:hypothetical protein